MKHLVILSLSGCSDTINLTLCYSCCSWAFYSRLNRHESHTICGSIFSSLYKDQYLAKAKVQFQCVNDLLLSRFVLEARSMAPHAGPSVIVSLRSTQRCSSTCFQANHTHKFTCVCVQQPGYQGLQECVCKKPSSVAAHCE